MNKDITFSDLLKKPDEEKVADVWVHIMELAKVLEDEKNYSRETVLHGLLNATLDLARKREDQAHFQSLNDTRRFYLFASEETKRRFDTCPNYREQREIEEIYGKDMLYIRNARNFGWKPKDD